MGVGGSIVQDHQDLEGEALRRAILLQLLEQLHLTVGLENIACHPATGVGVPLEGQAVLIIALKGTRVLGIVDQDGFQLAVSSQVSPHKEGDTVLKCLETWGRLLLHDVCAFRHLLLLQARFIHIKRLLGLVPPLLDDGRKFIRVQSSGVCISALSLTRVLDATEGIAALEIVKPALAGNKIGYGARLLRLQVLLAFHGLLLWCRRRSS